MNTKDIEAVFSITVATHAYAQKMREQIGEVYQNMVDQTIQIQGAVTSMQYPYAGKVMYPVDDEHVARVRETVEKAYGVFLTSSHNINFSALGFLIGDILRRVGGDPEKMVAALVRGKK